jgi:ectoine hydroxylase-related dioxygenase (phytanoyl-CoA dioxygenase family)
MFSEGFERGLKLRDERSGGIDRLRSINEHHSLRLPLHYDRSMLELATNAVVLAITRRLIGDYIVLNQQNGVINPASGEPYNQGRWHRDLPYQHFVSSHPLAVNALFCLDPFRADNGATFVLPGSQHIEAFPSDEMVERAAIQITAPAGSFIMLDGMTYHSGGVNLTDKRRRGVNHVYTIPLIKQQIDLPRCLGQEFSSDPEERKLLGYGIETPLSLEEYLMGRATRR